LLVAALGQGKKARVVFFVSAPPVTSLVSGAAGMARNRGRALASEALPRAADASIDHVEAFDNPDAARNPPEKCDNAAGFAGLSA